MIKIINCIECPKGCEIKAEIKDEQIKNLAGYSCQRGKAYAAEEVICPKRILTTTVRVIDGGVVSVKTDKGVNKSALFDIMQRINTIILDYNVKSGDMMVADIFENVNLIATSDYVVSDKKMY